MAFCLAIPTEGSAQGIRATASIPLYSSQALMLRGASFSNATPHGEVVRGYKKSLPSRIQFKDVLFFGGLLGLFSAGTTWDFNHLHLLTLHDPRWEILATLVISELSAGLAAVASQWIHLKRQSRLRVGQFRMRPVLSLLGTGMYSATVEKLIYVWALPLALAPLGLPLWLAAVTGALIDIVFISPRLTERLAYFVNARLEGASDEEAMEQLRTTGIEIYAYTSPFWFSTTLFSLLSHDPLMRFAWISVGVLIWNLIFAVKAGGRNSNDFLRRWAVHPVLRWTVPFLKRVQRSYEKPGQPATFKKWLLVLGSGSVLRELYLWHVPVSYLEIGGMVAVLGWILYRIPRVPRRVMIFAGPLLALLLSPLVQAADFTGETCQHCHDLIRDRAPIDLSTVRRIDHVFDSLVIGGGASGLMAGYELAKQHRDVQVLEKNEQPGGHATTVELWGRRYSPAAVYMNRPEGWIKTLFHHLGIAPTKIADPMDAMFLGGKLIADFWEHSDEFPYSEHTKAHFRQLIADLKKMDRAHLFEQSHWKDPQSAALGRITFAKFLNDHYEGDQTILHFGGLFARDMFGGATDISARIALRFLRDELKDGYSFEADHGLGTISSALAKSLGDRVKTSALVIHVEEKDGIVSVVYQDGDGHYVVEKSRTAVIATPAQVTRRIVVGLPPDKQAAFDGIQMSTYLVIFLRFNHTVWNQSYALWEDPMDARRIATEITFPDWQNPRTDGTEVGVLYMPLGTQARAGLAATSAEAFLPQALSDLDALLPGASASVIDDKIFPWPHGMEQPTANYPVELLAQPVGHLKFAGEATAGQPLIEESLSAGRRAAQEADKDLKQQRRSSKRLKAAA